jgi:hypothetical protein
MLRVPLARVTPAARARGIFTSGPDLKRKLMHYIRQYKKQPKLLKWKYLDPCRIASASTVTVH